MELQHFDALFTGSSQEAGPVIQPAGNESMDKFFSDHSGHKTL